ncbi:MAG TPA: hypothetical protein VM689_25285 [Aliidongia sp.]|nr:hypothetical protein [Aliidongia sp.]
MRKLAIGLAIIALLVAGAGIWLEEQLTPRLTFPPIVSAEVFDGSVSRSLGSGELAELSRWLERTRINWQTAIGTPSLPKAYLSIKHSDGQITGLDLFNDNSVQLGGWSKVVMLTQVPPNRDPKKLIRVAQRIADTDMLPILKVISK